MSGRRYHAIDKLRASMILTVAFGHTMLPYVTFPRRLKDPATSIGFDVAGIFLYSFAMDLFFLTAGFTAALMLAKRGARDLLRNRVQRILWPFLVAWLVLAPLTRGAFKFARAVTDTGSIEAGIDVLTHQHWLDWSKIYHLWFLPVLVLFLIAALALRHAAIHYAPRVARRVDAVARRLLASPWRAAWLAVAIIVPVSIGCLFPYGSFGSESMSGLCMFGFFLVGWTLFRHRRLLSLHHSQWSWLLALAALTTPMTVWAMRIRLFEGPATDPLIGIAAGIGNTVLVCCMTFGLLGLFQSRLDQPSAVWRYISDASYWIYLVHYPLVIAAGAIVSVTVFPAGIKYLLTLAIVLPILVLSYEFAARRSPPAPAS